MGEAHSKFDKMVEIEDGIYFIATRPCADFPEPAHTRPLPPPHCRSSVLETILEFSCKEKISSSISPSGVKRPSDSLADELSSIMSQPTPQSHSTASPSESTNLPSTKKRRLFTNDQAVEIAQQMSERHPDPDTQSSSSDTVEPTSDTFMPIQNISTSLTAGQGFDGDNNFSETSTSRAHGPFNTDDSSDEGYCTYSPNSPSNDFAEDDDESLVRHLAKLHEQSMANTVDDTDDPRTSSFQLPMLRKLREEDESAQQSRLLREKKLSAPRPEIPDHEDSDDDLILTSDDHLEFDDLSAQDSLNKGVGSNQLTSAWRMPHKTPLGSSSLRSRNSVNPQHRMPDSDTDVGSETDHHALLDYTEAHARRSTTSPKPRLRRINPKTPRYRRFPPRLHPRSCVAAEQYRTQSRHLDKPMSAEKGLSAAGSSSGGESRLRAFTSKVHALDRPSSHPTVKRFNSPPVQKHQKFHGIDMGTDSARERMRLTSYDQLRLHSPVTTIANQSQDVAESSIPDTDADQRPTKPLSLLQMMAKKSTEENSGDTSVAVIDSEMSTVELGTRAEIDSENEDEVRGEHERLKDQQRDLEAIESACMAIAQMRAIYSLTDAELKQEHDVRKFISRVLDQNGQGKERRPRVQQVRDNFHRRLEKERARPSLEAIGVQYQEILGDHRVKRLQELKCRLEELIWDFKIKRTNLRRSREKKTGRHSKKVRWASDIIDGTTREAHIADSTEIELGNAPRGQSKPGSKRGNEMSRLRNQLERYQALEAARKYKEKEATSIADDQDEASTISEEDPDGGNYPGISYVPSSSSSFTASASASYSGGRSSSTTHYIESLDEIKTLENERQKEARLQASSQYSYGPESTFGQRRGCQEPDADLIEQMRVRMRLHQQESDARAATIPYDDVDGISDAEGSVTSGTSSASTPSAFSTNIVQRHRYTVNGQYVGIDIYAPGEEYIHKTFNNYDRANAYITEVLMRSLCSDYEKAFDERHNFQSIGEGGVLQMLLCLGRDEEIQAKWWIEKDIISVDLGKIAAKKARKAILGEEKFMWAVDWEKTVTTTFTDKAATPASTTDEQSAPEEQPHVEDDTGSIFGTTPPQPTDRSSTASTPEIPAQQTPITTRPSPEESYASLFTTLPLANRAAKEKYMKWWAPFFPEAERPYWGRIQPASGSPYEGNLKQIDLALEVELENMGDMAPARWENDVVVKTNREDNEGKEGEERMEEREVTESMRVWVRRVAAMGPTN